MEVDSYGRRRRRLGHRDDRFHWWRLMCQAGQDFSSHGAVVTAEHPVVHLNQLLNTRLIDGLDQFDTLGVAAPPGPGR